MELYEIFPVQNFNIRKLLNTKNSQTTEYFSTLIEVYLTTLCSLIFLSVEAEIFNTLHSAYLFFKAVEAEIFNTLHSAYLFFKAVEAEKFLTHYILLTNFSKLMKLRFLTHYIPFTYFSKLLKLRFFIAIHFAYC